MPGMDGVECTKALKASEFSNIPIIIFTLEASSHVDVCLEIGATAVIEKPVALETFEG